MVSPVEPSRPLSLDDLITSLPAARGDSPVSSNVLARAEELAQSFEPSPARALLFAGLSSAWSRKGEEGRANKLAIRALNSAERLPTIAQQITALTLAGRELAAGGNGQLALDSLARTASLARKLDDQAARSQALIQTAAAYGASGAPDRARDLLIEAFGSAEAPAPEAPAPAASASPEPAAEPPELEPDVPELAADLSELEAEIAPITEPAPFAEAATIAGSGAAARSSSSTIATEEGSFNDPAAGVQFPKFTGLRRRRRS